MRPGLARDVVLCRGSPLRHRRHPWQRLAPPASRSAPTAGSSSTSATAAFASARAWAPSPRIRPSNACRRKMQQVDLEGARRAHRPPSFADCAQRNLAQLQDMRSLEAIRIHVQLLIQPIGHHEPHQVHDATPAPPFRNALPTGFARSPSIEPWRSRARSCIARRARIAMRTGVLRKRRCRPLAARGQSGAEPPGNAHRAARGECLRSS